MFLLVFALCFQGCKAQSNKDKSSFILGEWQSVKEDYRGYQKFTLDQANQIKASTLTISDDAFYYEGIDFIEPCQFYEWEITPFDTAEYLGHSIEFKYDKNELARFLTLTPSDENGDLACFNECATFFLNGDTLINVCGGYTFYLTKSPLFLERD